LKNLDLNDFGVQEMNEKEMNAVDGGKVNWLWVLASSAAGLAATLKPAGVLVGAFIGIVASSQANQ